MVWRLNWLKGLSEMHFISISRRFHCVAFIMASGCNFVFNWKANGCYSNSPQLNRLYNLIKARLANVCSSTESFTLWRLRCRTFCRVIPVEAFYWRLSRSLQILHHRCYIAGSQRLDIVVASSYRWLCIPGSASQALHRTFRLIGSTSPYIIDLLPAKLPRA